MVFDLHNDLLTSGESLKNMREYIRNNASNTITLAYWTSREKSPFEKLCGYTAEFGKYKNIRLAVEDMGFLTDEMLPEFIRLPLLYCTLVWKDVNPIAGGHNTDSGLTAYGKDIVKKLYGAKIKIDTAHLSERSFYDCADTVSDIFNSHCCQKSIKQHTRNLSDDQIREIISRKGIVGLCAVNDFFSDKKGIEGYCEQIDTFAQRFGCDFLAVGTDFFGTEPIDGLATYNDFESLKVRLKNLGYADSDIQKIFSTNAEHYFNAI